jgi:uncharacterized protein (DUF697 family)
LGVASANIARKNLKRNQSEKNMNTEETQSIQENHEIHSPLQNHLRQQARDVIKYHALMSAGFGAIPIPVADMAAVAGVQANMIHDLAKLYAIPFKKEYARTAIASILGGGLPFAVSITPAITSALKIIPVVGTTLGAVLMPSLSVVTTIALGRLFQRHFEAGGNLLNLNVDELRKHFRKEFESAKEESKNLQAETS